MTRRRTYWTYKGGPLTGQDFTVHGVAGQRRDAQANPTWQVDRRAGYYDRSQPPRTGQPGVYLWRPGTQRPGAL